MKQRTKINLVRMALQESRGRFFTVVFIKRGDGSKRTMNCRAGVGKHLTGGSLGYDPIEKRLATVWEGKSCKGKDKGYRQIPLENVLEIRLKGFTIKFEGEDNV